MVQKKRNEKKFGVMLLIGLCVYAFLTIFLVNMGNVSVEHSEIKAQTDLVGMTNTFEYREIEKLEVKEEEVEVSYESGEEVKGAGTVKPKLFMGGRCYADYQIEAPQLFCGSGGKGLAEVKIRIAEIYVPDILFIGTAAPFDNLVLTSNPMGWAAYRNASEIINEDFDYLINMPPMPKDSPENPRNNLFDEEEKDEPFEIHYEVARALEKIPFDVDPEEESLCPDVVNDGRFNVKGSNQLQKDLTDLFTPPGVMELGDRDLPVNLCREDVRRIDLTEEESYRLCWESPLETIYYDIVSIFKSRKECDDIYGIVVDAPLGSGEICNEEDCSVRYSEAARIISSPPIWTRDLYPQGLSPEQKENDYIVDDPVILTTPCKVRLNDKLCPTVCIWDISMWQHVYNLEKMYTYPGYKTALEEDEYWEKLEHELRIRGSLGTAYFY